MQVGPIPDISVALPVSAERADLRKASQGFEAIFVRQLLAAARASSVAGDSFLNGPGLQQFTAMRDEHFARIAADSGAFGLAAAIERQLAANIAGQGG